MPCRVRLLLVVSLTIAPVLAVAAEPTPPGRPKFALLIGVGKYKHLGPSEQLDGARNDVEAMRSVLVDPRVGFRPEDIQCLTDESATGDAIRGALRALSRRVDALPAGSPPAQVVVHYSGHGSQLPDQPDGDPRRDEADGLDETIVPHDAQKQGGPQDIRDDELFEFAEEVCGDGRARLWMVLDCCHSGTGARGSVKVRKLDRSFPAAAAPAVGRNFNERRLAPGAVVLSACRAQEVEPEYQEGKDHFGLLTRFVIQVLNETPKLSTLSYDLLRDQVVSCYRRDPSVAQPPLPQIEGEGKLLRGTVLGLGTEADRKPYWEVIPSGPDRSKAILKAGAFHGITAGSLYELYDEPGKIVWEPAPAAQGRASEGSVAWLRIAKVEGTSATAEVFRWEDGKRSEARLPAGFKLGFAVERYRENEAFGLRLRVVRAVSEREDGPALGPSSPEVPAVVRDALSTANLPDESRWLEWTVGDARCDFLLRIDGDFAALMPATGKVAPLPDGSEKRRGSEVPRSLKGGWGPFALGEPEEAGPALKKALRQVCRARNLIRLADAWRGRSSSGSSAAGSITIDLLKVEVDDSGAITRSAPWTPDAGALTVRKGDRYAYRIMNCESSGKPWFITVLAIDPDMGIDQVLPYQEAAGSEVSGEQRLGPGESRITDAFECEGGFGPRLVVVLATREPNSFYTLSQPSLARVRGGDGPLGRETALGSLLLEQTYFKTRGDRRVKPQKLYDDSWTARILSFTASP